jgi:phosphatidylserine/phosphatidylglycerophosphate/cardiolipin synthase-like enzyme
MLEALRKAKKSIHILIFRLDRAEIEKALVEAVGRGVAVQALVAFTNRGGEKNLRRFEMRLLERGITVTRTADDLVRYHGKMFIVDGRELHLLAFNFTHLDISLSRSFSFAVTDKALVDEALKLFECDSKRLPYTAGHKDFVVSPINAREQLTNFIRGAKKQLLMYEMKISDPEFLKLLNEKISAGVDVRVIGRATRKAASLPVRAMPMRLHARAILRDGHDAFLGSQSLRNLELDARRELGVIVHDKDVVRRMIEVFDKDWREATPEVPSGDVASLINVPAKKVAKSVAKQLRVENRVEQILDRALDKKDDLSIEPKELAETVRDAVREEVHDAVQQALHDLVASAVANNGSPQPEEKPAPKNGK